MTAVDWSRWRKCQVCAARIGEACTFLTGYSIGDNVQKTARAAMRVPHGSRKPRTRNYRTGGA